jgi:hypothetical protein
VLRTYLAISGDWTLTGYEFLITSLRQNCWPIRGAGRWRLWVELSGGGTSGLRPRKWRNYA